MIPDSVVIAAVSKNPWTALVLSAEGDVAEVVAFSTEPTAQTFLGFARTRAQGRRFRFLQQAHLNEAELKALLVDAKAPAVDSSAPPAPLRVIEEFEPRLSPSALMRGIVPAISNWLAKYLG